MNYVEFLSQFSLSQHGDSRERELWPLLSKDFPTYEAFWRLFVVPRTQRVDLDLSPNNKRWIRLRPNLSTRDERIVMAHYSVFYFLGRSVQRFSDNRGTSSEHPEDIFFLLNSATENVKAFLIAVEEVAKDQGSSIIDGRFNRFPKGFTPFEEIEAYRNAFSHNAVLGRASTVGRTLVPRWNPVRTKSALNRAERSWREAEKLPVNDLIEITFLLERLIREMFLALEAFWRKALAAVPAGAPLNNTNGFLKFPALSLLSLDQIGSTNSPAASGINYPDEE